MITRAEYMVMGEDGKDYGPVSAEQICRWLDEGRLDRKTPVLPDGAKDWIFLGMLPEFAEAFDPAKRKVILQPKPRPNTQKWLVLVAFSVALAGIFLIALKKITHP